MEVLSAKIQKFLEVDFGTGNGNGYGDGYGDGYGNGYGYGYGDGDGYGYGNGDGYGYGYGYGDGYGNGNGIGIGSGYGNGDGNGYGSGIKSINGMAVHKVDGVPTAITQVRGDIAKGYLLNRNVYLTPCYIVKQGNMFAHGATLREAQAALDDKLFEDMPAEERIESFLQEFPKTDTPYPNELLFDWHHKLTGSCLMGRNAFIESHGISLDGKTTVREFIALTENAYGSDIIRQLKTKVR